MARTKEISTIRKGLRRRNNTDDEVASQIHNELELSLNRNRAIRDWNEFAGSERYQWQGLSPTQKPKSRCATRGKRAGLGFSMLVEGAKAKPEPSSSIKRPTRKKAKTYGKSISQADIYDLPSSSAENDDLLSQPVESEGVSVDASMHEYSSEGDSVSSEDLMASEIESRTELRADARLQKSDGIDRGSVADEMNHSGKALKTQPVNGKDIEAKASIHGSSDEHSLLSTGTTSVRESNENMSLTIVSRDKSATAAASIGAEEFDAVVINVSDDGSSKLASRSSIPYENTKNPANTSELTSQAQASDARQLLLEARQTHAELEMIQESIDNENGQTSVEGNDKDDATRRAEEQAPPAQQMPPWRHRKRRRQQSNIDETPKGQVFQDELSQDPASTDEIDEYSDADSCDVVASDSADGGRQPTLTTQAQDSHEEDFSEDEDEICVNLYRNSRAFKSVSSLHDTLALKTAWERLFNATLELSLEAKIRRLRPQSESTKTLLGALMRVERLYDEAANEQNFPSIETTEADLMTTTTALVDEAISKTRTLEFEDESNFPRSEKQRRLHQIPGLALELSMIVFPAIISVTTACLLLHHDQASVDSQGLSYAHNLLGCASKIADRLRPSNFRTAAIQVADHLRVQRKCLPHVQDACLQKMATAHLEEAYRKNLESYRFQGYSVEPYVHRSQDENSSSSSDDDFPPAKRGTQLKRAMREWTAEEEDTLLRGLYRYRHWGKNKYREMQQAFDVLSTRSISEMREKANRMSDQWALINKQEGKELDPVTWSWLLNV